MRKAVKAKRTLKTSAGIVRPGQVFETRHWKELIKRDLVTADLGPVKAPSKRLEDPEPKKGGAAAPKKTAKKGK